MLDAPTLTLKSDQIDEMSPVPLYQQIYELLRAAILDGRLKVNARLPAEQDLTQ